MKVQYEFDGVVVQAEAGPDGRVTALDVSVAEAGQNVHVRPTTFDGRPTWTITGIPGSFIGPFDGAWEQLYELDHKGRTYQLHRAIAEIVDAQGMVTEPGTGLSAAIAKCKAAISDLEKGYLTAEVVELLRGLLADEGYSVVPDLGRLKKLGFGARNCFAYHEIVGNAWDRMTRGKDGVSVEELLKHTEFYNAFHEFLEG